MQPNETKDFGEDVCREDIKRYADIQIDIHIPAYTCKIHTEICREDISREEDVCNIRRIPCNYCNVIIGNPLAKSTLHILLPM